MASSSERLRQLEQAEKQLVNCVQSLGLCLQELSKDKMTAVKQVEVHSQTFLNGLELLESSLNGQINYLAQVSTGNAHEGSPYGSQKALDMALHRQEHSRTRLKELEMMRMHHIREQNASLMAKRERPSTSNMPSQ
jgi:hypothetical protein